MNRWITTTVLLAACGRPEHGSPTPFKPLPLALTSERPINETVADYRGYEQAPSTASQTAWALLGLMAAGEVEHAAVRRGIAYLAEKQGADGFWDEERYTATGFPRVFYLRYHGYRRFFPLWAMARYRNLTSGNSRVVSFGM